MKCCRKKNVIELENRIKFLNNKIKSLQELVKEKEKKFQDLLRLIEEYKLENDNKINLLNINKLSTIDEKNYYF